MKPSERIKAEVSLRHVAEAAGVTWDLKKSRQAKGDWWAPCPIHGEATASFHVQEPGGTGGLFKCFGCGAGGSVIDFVMAMDGCDFTTAVRRLTSENGLTAPLSEERRQTLEKDRQAAQDRAEAAAKASAEAGHARALRFWADAERVGFGGKSALASYLLARGVNLAAMGGVPATLRLAWRLEHWQGGYRAGSRADHTGPAMVAAIGRGKILGVHRTWITKNGRATYGDGRKVEKQWLGRTGAMMGQPCVLSKPGPRVVVGEGIETTLAAFGQLVSDGQAGWSAEAALSRGAITGPTRD
ncbi:MAG: CHC2 zinc finger domain-containing protein, partial [Pseudomonadota bacterium]